MDNCGIRFQRLAALTIILAVSILGSSCVFFTHPQRSTVAIDTWITENKTFKIRVTSYGENGAMVSGAYYVFESTSKDSTAWGEIMTFRHDDQVSIPKDQIRFVNDQIGYVFMGWMFAVTTDSGASWSVWDASKNPELSKNYNYNLIREVSLLQNGTGRILLSLTGDTKAELQTTDYGRHWTAE